jgi:hypothetical protein
MRFPAILLGAVAGAFLASAGCTAILGINKDYTEGDGGLTGSGGHGTTSSSSGSTTGTGGGGGAGGHPDIPCVDPTDCPGKENECAHRTCEASLCGMGFTAAGTAVAQQNTGDCKKVVCDGKGGLAEQNDDSDRPDDSNPCTDDACNAGVAGHTPAAVGKSCGGTLTCDGNGNCTGCTGPGECPGLDTDCQTRGCSSGVCGFVYKVSGTPVPTQTPADCKQSVCNGQGQVSVIGDPSDPEDDGNPCTLDTCSSGTPAHNDAAAGAPCPGGICDGNGACVKCLVADTCPGQNNECQTRTCVGGTCGMTYTAMGTAVALQAGSDCKTNVCDGQGGITTVPNDADLQDDGNPCTTDACSGGNPVHNALPQGTPCGGNFQCNATGSCVGCNTNADCPGANNECQQQVCAGNVCGTSYTPAGKPAGTQTPGDCKKVACDGAGNLVGMIDDADVPVDGDPCTDDVCSSGSGSNPAAAAGTTCPGGVCNGAGGCGVCVPGAFKACCAGFSNPCCYQNPAAQAKSPDASYPDEDPNIGCCCDGTNDCDATGHWTGCY